MHSVPPNTVSGDKHQARKPRLSVKRVMTGFQVFLHRAGRADLVREVPSRIIFFFILADPWKNFSKSVFL